MKVESVGDTGTVTTLVTTRVIIRVTEPVLTVRVVVIMVTGPTLNISTTRDTERIVTLANLPVQVFEKVLAVKLIVQL